MKVAWIVPACARALKRPNTVGMEGDNDAAHEEETEDGRDEINQRQREGRVTTERRHGG